MNKETFYFFLDETGDHGLSFVDKDFPYFLLCGCLLPEKEKKNLEEGFLKIKKNFFNSTSVILHSRDIRKCEKDFKVLFDLKIKEDFYKSVNRTIDQLNFAIISSAIQKENLIRKYGKQANNPYSLSLSFIIERLIFFLDDLNREANVEIYVESRGKEEDKNLLNQFNKILDSGTHWVSSERIKNRISHFEFRKKFENDNGLQLADLCAYPLVRNLIYPENLYIPFDLIKDKIYSKGNKNYGMKVFP